MNCTVSHYLVQPAQNFFAYAAEATKDLTVAQKLAELVSASLGYGNQFAAAPILPKLDETVDSVARFIDFWELRINAVCLISWNTTNFTNIDFEFVAHKALSLANVCGAMIWSRSIQLCSFDFLGKVGSSLGQVRYFGFAANVTLNSALRSFLIVGFISKAAQSMLVVLSGNSKDVTRAAAMSALSHGLYATISGVVLFAGFNPLGLGLVAAAIGFYQSLPTKKNDTKSDDTKTFEKI